MNKIEINVPERYEAIKTDKGYDIVPIKVEKSPDEKLQECMDKIEKYNKCKKHYYFITAWGTVDKDCEFHTYNHAPENIIKAEQIQMIWRRLALMYNEGKKDNEYWYISSIGSKIDIDVLLYKSDESIYFFSREGIEKAIKEIGEENLIFMLNNL